MPHFLGAKTATGREMFRLVSGRVARQGINRLNNTNITKLFGKKNLRKRGIVPYDTKEYGCMIIMQICIIQFCGMDSGL